MRKSTEQRFWHLVANERPLLVKRARRLLNGSDEGEDVVSEAIIRASAHMARLTLNDCQIRDYVYRTIHGIAFDIRKSRRWNNEAQRYDEVLENRAAHTQRHRDFDLDAVREMVRSLPPDMSRAVIDFYWRGRTALEISSELGVNEAVIKMRLYRARRALATRPEMRVSYRAMEA